MAHESPSMPGQTTVDVDEGRPVELRQSRQPDKPLWRMMLEPLASLKLTVVLLALSIVLGLYRHACAMADGFVRCREPLFPSLDGACRVG